MNNILILNGLSIPYEDIKSGVISGKTEFEEATLLFCRQWLNGQSTFSLKTSGSTGKPKEIDVSRDQMLASAKQTIDYFMLAPADTVLVCLNTAYIAGIMMLVRGFVAKTKIIVVEPSANPLLLTESKIDFLAVVPLQLETILLNKTTTARLEKIRATIVGGAPVSYTLQKKLAKTSSKIWASFGMTETLTHFALKQLNPEPEDVYTALSNTEISLNKNGCLVVSSTVTNGTPVETNDLVELKSKNQFHWLGRIDNVLNTGGIKLQMETLEKKVEWMMLEQNFDYNFFIAAKDDEKLGQAVELIIEGEEDETNFKTVSWDDYFERYEKPRKISFLPRFVYTPTGKINRDATMKLIKLWT